MDKLGKKWKKVTSKFKNVQKIDSKKSNPSIVSSRDVVEPNPSNVASRDVVESNSSNVASRDVVEPNSSNVASRDVVEPNPSNVASRDVVEPNPSNVASRNEIKNLEPINSLTADELAEQLLICATRARMATPYIQALIKLGHKRKVIYEIIKERLSKVGDDFETNQKLVEAILDVEFPSLISSKPAIDESTQSTSFQSADTLLDEKMNVATDYDIAHHLPDEIKNMMTENKQINELKTCKICQSTETNTVFLPCGHLMCCNICAHEVQKCPMCRALIRGTVRMSLSN